MSATIIKRGEHGECHEWRCECGETLWSNGPGRDFHCEKCGTEYNSGGQTLAPRSQWGWETGEHPSDIARAFNSDNNSLDEDW